MHTNNNHFKSRTVLFCICMISSLIIISISIIIMVDRDLLACCYYDKDSYFSSVLGSLTGEQELKHQTMEKKIGAKQEY